MKKKQRMGTTSTGAGTRRKVTRLGKSIMESNFKRMKWTETFVYEPVDPKWNPYMFYG